jgi:broad specificity phosphatase PhoE
MLSLPPKDDATRLLLIRHLEPDESIAGRAYGALDVPLSAAARERAERLAGGLAGVPLAAVYTSPLRRAVETAVSIASRHGVVPRPHEGLRELHFGELEGERFDDLRQREPELFDAWMSDPTGVVFPGGESFSDLRRRALTAAEGIRRSHVGDTVAVVTHGGVARAILADTLEMPARALFRLDQPYGAVSVVDWLDATPVVRLVNADLITPPGGRA